jgi:hypothetical protein
MLPLPLFAALSTVTVPIGDGVRPADKNIVVSSEPPAADGVGLGVGVGVGEEIGVGVGVGPGDELETEPHPAEKINNNARNKKKVALRFTGGSLDRDFHESSGELLTKRAAAHGRLSQVVELELRYLVVLHSAKLSSLRWPPWLHRLELYAVEAM